MFICWFLRTERHIISIARKKERPGLSTFGTSSSHEIVNYIAQFLIDAATVIPEKYHNTTQVRLTCHAWSNKMMHRSYSNCSVQ